MLFPLMSGAGFTSFSGFRATLAQISWLTPARALCIAYIFCAVLGAALLMLPAAQAEPLALVDTLFLAVSAVSTTGLITVDPASSLTAFGEAVLLVLIQTGGIAFMFIGSLVMAALQREGRQVSIGRGFHVHMHFSLDFGGMVRRLLIFTFAVEALGAALLFPAFLAQGVENPLWQAVFHAVSAVCTAGFSLFADNLHSFRADWVVSGVMGVLCLLGGLGYLVVADIGLRLRPGASPRLGRTGVTIMGLTVAFVALGTLAFGLLDPGLRPLPAGERWLAAWFQVASASATAGFSTTSLTGLAHPAMLILVFLMIAGASPAGTGGGLKKSAFATLLALIVSTFRGSETIRFLAGEVSFRQLQSAAASLAFYGLAVFMGLLALTIAEPDISFDRLVFETVSAMGAVGLSLGVTASLSTAGKVIVMAIITAGLIGLLSFGLSLATGEDEVDEAENNETSRRD